MSKKKKTVAFEKKIEEAIFEEVQIVEEPKLEEPKQENEKVDTLKHTPSRYYKLIK